VLGGDEQLLDLDRPAVAVAHRDCVLPSGRRYGTTSPWRTSASRFGQLVGQPHRQRHELRGLAARVAEHHALVAGAGDVELIVVGGIGARLVGLVDALRDVGRLLVESR